MPHNLRLTTHEELHQYFEKWVGPVFCVTGRNLLQRRPDMMNMVGMIRPPSSRDSKLWHVDWSLDKKYNEVKAQYSLGETSDLYLIEDLCVIKPGADIPALAYANYHGWLFTDFKTGDVVCVSQHRLITSKGTEQAYATIHDKVGVVNDRCHDLNDNSVMVAFTTGHESRVVNVEKAVLVKLPPSFGPPVVENSYHHIPANCGTGITLVPKLKVGQIVRVNSSIQDETWMGLVGVVKENHQRNSTLIGFSSQYGTEYTVDFNVLPTRNISLIKGEKGVICTKKQLREFDLEAWDERISDMAHLDMFRARWDRDLVWSIEDGCIGRVDMKSNAKKTLADGISVKVNLLDEKGNITKSRNTTCRSLDHIWDESVLIEIAKISAITLGVEEDKRNPNEVCSKVYLYFFDNKDQVGKFLKFRILLGTLLKRKSVVKKFAKALLQGTFLHPWQVKRYLRPDSLGHFYSIFNANEWLTRAGEFVSSDA